MDSALVDRITHFIETHLAEPLTLNRLAGHFFLSPTHFAKTFRDATGTPPHRFVISRRMERARTLVTRSDSSVVEIAYAVGYTNVSYFRRSFRREFGVLPCELRSGATSVPPLLSANQQAPAASCSPARRAARRAAAGAGVRRITGTQWRAAWEPQDRTRPSPHQ